MKKKIITILLVFLLVGCQTEVSNEADSENEFKTKIEDLFVLNTFQLYLMQTSPSLTEELQPPLIFEFHLPEEALIVHRTYGEIGMDGSPLQIPPQRLQHFEITEEGHLTFTYEQEVITAEGSEIEERTEIFQQLSNSVFENQHGIRYELSTEF